MAKPKTLREQAREALMKVKPHNGRYVYAEEAWCMGHRAGSRLTKAERKVIEAAVKWQSSRDKPTHIRSMLLTHLGAAVLQLKNSKKVRK